jgi:hypothetical protein
MIPLAEAVKLKSILQKKFTELIDERRRVAFISVEKGTIAQREGRTITIVEQELDVIRKDIRTLDRLIYVANSTHTISFLGEELTVVEAIEYAKQLRLEAIEARSFSENEKETMEYGFGEHVQMVRVALFDPEAYRLRADELERLAHRLSNAINAKNYEVKIPFDDSNYM